MIEPYFFTTKLSAQLRLSETSPVFKAQRQPRVQGHSPGRFEGVMGGAGGSQEDRSLPPAVRDTGRRSVPSEKERILFATISRG